MSGNTMMFKKELKKHILPFPENLTFHDVWIGFVASTISSVQYTNEPLVFYRQHDNNITNITRSKHREKQTLKEKIIKKSIAMKQKSNYLAAYYNFLQKNSQDNKNMNIIKNISKEYCQYENYYFNIKLFSLLLNHKNDIFISKKQKRLSFILKNCLGLKAYKLVHFL